MDTIKIPTEPPVMTIIPWRSQTVKVHPTMGKARAAVAVQHRYLRGADGTYRYGVVRARIYVWRDGAWQLEHDIAHGTPLEELPWKKAAA